MKFKKYFFIYKTQILSEKNYDFSAGFFELLSNLSDFVISDDSTEKITSKSIRIYPVFILKRFKVNKRSLFSSEKKRISGNYIYDYNHLFFGKNFKSKPLYLWLITEGINRFICWGHEPREGHEVRERHEEEEGGKEWEAR